jgi:hypothetical protein
LTFSLLLLLLLPLPPTPPVAELTDVVTIASSMTIITTSAFLPPTTAPASILHLQLVLKPFNYNSAFHCKDTSLKTDQ